MELTKAKQPSIEKAAASIADLVDELGQLGRSAEGKAELARVIERRLRRFWPAQ